MRRVAGVVGLLSLSCGFVWGAGFQLYTEGSAEALGQAGAISARPDMVSNAWYNPASLAGAEGRALQLGVTTAKLSFSYDPPGAGDTADMRDEIHLIPSLYYVHPISEKVTGTLAFNVPYGLGTEWDDDVWIPTGFGGMGMGPTLEMQFATHTLTPSVAYKATDKLSLALGVSVGYSDLYYRAYVGAAGQAKHEADGFGSAYSLSANYEVNDDWRVGVKYQSSMRIALEGRVHFTGPVGPTGIDGTVTLPPSVTAGVSTTTFGNLTLGVDVVWTGWHTYDELHVYYDGGALAGTPASTKNWSDVFSYRLGAEYQLNEAWTLRSGYVYDNTPANGEYRSQELPDGDRHMLCVGAGYAGEKWSVDLAYCLILVEDTPPGSKVLAPTTGDYQDGGAHLASISVGYKF